MLYIQVVVHAMKISAIHGNVNYSNHIECWLPREKKLHKFCTFLHVLFVISASNHGCWWHLEGCMQLSAFRSELITHADASTRKPVQFCRCYNLQPWYWNSLLYGLISSEENSVHFLQLMPFTMFQFSLHKTELTANEAVWRGNWVILYIIVHNCHAW